MLPFTMTLTGGEDADGVQITKVTCFQSGNNRMTTLSTRRRCNDSAAGSFRRQRRRKSI